MIVPHDEIISLSQYFGIPGQFVYAVHTLSLQRLRTIYADNGTVQESELTLLDNIGTPLLGSDTIGVWLDYTDYRVGCWCQVFHKDVIGTNATLFMVAVGVLASLLEFLQAYPSMPGVSSVEDLNTERLLGTVKRYMQIHERREDIDPYHTVNPLLGELYVAPVQGRNI
jgi:homospermidine synthase